MWWQPQPETRSFAEGVALRTAALLSRPGHFVLLSAAQQLSRPGLGNKSVPASNGGEELGEGAGGGVLLRDDLNNLRGWVELSRRKRTGGVGQQTGWWASASHCRRSAPLTLPLAAGSTRAATHTSATWDRRMEPAFPGEQQ